MIPDEWLVSTVPPRVKIGHSVIGLIGVIHVASPKCVFDTWLTFSHCLLIIFNAYLFSQWQFIHISDNKVSIFCRNKTSADGYFAESLSGDLLNTRKICFIRRLFPPHKNRDCVPARASPKRSDSHVQVQERRPQLEKWTNWPRAFLSAECWERRPPPIQLGSNLQSWRFPLTFLQHSNYRNGSRGMFIKMKWVFAKP